MKNLLIVFLFLGLKFSSHGQLLSSENKVVKTGQVEYLTTQAFKEKIFDYSASKEWLFKGKIPVIIDFYADWCRPCKMLSPIIEDISIDFKGKIQVYKVNIDKEPELAQIFGIQSIPSVLFIPLKEKPQMNVGLLSKEELNNKIISILNVKK